MLLHIYEDEHGWIYEPHGVESEFWSTTLEGSRMLLSSGWRPYSMHRVSRYLHDSLLIDGLLCFFGGDQCQSAFKRQEK
jgi:hypothetical protein